MLRLTGEIERICAIQHHHGIYRSVAATATYSTDSGFQSLQDFQNVIEEAISKVILRHPALAVGIINEDSEYPAFVHLDSINLLKCIEYRFLSDTERSNDNQVLQQLLDHQHSQLWTNLHSQPGWKVIVVQPEAMATGRATFDAIFCFHHSLGDGTSGLIFHKSLLKELNAPTEYVGSEEHVLKVSYPTRLPPPIEQQINFKTSLQLFIQEYWKATKPRWLKLPWKATLWEQLPCAPEHLQNYKSRSKIVSITPGQLANIVAACRKESATVTGLLHAIIVASMTSQIPQAQKLIGGVPHSMRFLLPESTKNEIGNFAWGHNITYPPKTIGKIRSSKTDAETTEQVWNMARSFRVSTAAELARLPGDSLLGVLHYAKKEHKTLKGMVGRPWNANFGLSNLGVFRNRNENGRWAIEKIVFSQSGTAISIPLFFNVVSVADGPMTICATWLDGVVDEMVVEKFCQDLVRGLESVRVGSPIYFALDG